jgi:hypothetical protein
LTAGEGGSVYAVSLIASLPSQLATQPLLVIADGSLWQSIVLKAADIPFVTLPQRGTVTATAIDLALALGTGPVYLAGIDLGSSGIKSHAAPYPLDEDLRRTETRLRPYYSQAASRTAALKGGGAGNTYADWFREEIPRYPPRLVALPGSSSVFAGLKKPVFEQPRTANPAPLSFDLFQAAQADAQTGARHHFDRFDADQADAKTGARHPFDHFSCRPVDALLGALDDPSQAATLTKELAPLLLADGQTGEAAGKDALARALKDCALSTPAAV